MDNKPQETSSKPPRSATFNFTTTFQNLSLNLTPTPTPDPPVPTDPPSATPANANYGGYDSAKRAQAYADGIAAMKHCLLEDRALNRQLKNRNKRNNRKKKNKNKNKNKSEEISPARAAFNARMESVSIWLEGVYPSPIPEAQFQFVESRKRKVDENDREEGEVVEDDDDHEEERRHYPSSHRCQEQCERCARCMRAVEEDLMRYECEHDR
ncbi:hypothetical protein TWF730_006963 [Orbilia blumenaviensis]|uniref:Uncharacterized protein n=1 Tax=Orbilia blumenaviensis TaxID=1796055 RepID=A0AAV9VJ94_9PEZI